MVDYFAIESYQVEKYGKDRRILANWTTRRVAPRRTLWVALGKKKSHLAINKARVLSAPKKSDLDSKNIQLPHYSLLLSLADI